MPASTFGELPGDAARAWGDRVALVHGEQRLSFTALSQQVDSAARALIALGVRPGERIALWLVNRTEWVVLMFAAARVGAIVVPLNTRYRTDDLAYTLRHSRAVLLVLQDESGPVHYGELWRATGAAPAFPDLREVVMLGQASPGCTGWGDFLARAAEVDDAQLAARAAAVRPSDPFLVAYTSGTTGPPKGVLHSHACLRSVRDRIARFGITAADVNINYLPLFHLYGLSEGCLVSLAAGATQVLMPGFSAAAVLEAVQAERGTLLHGFDAHYGDLLREQRAHPREVGSLRLATYPAGQAQSAAIARQVQAELCQTVSGYGMTETWAFCACSEADASAEQRCSASGTPMPGIEFRIRDDESGALRGDDAEGLLEIRGYALTPGYLDDPEATARAFTADGWFITGDRARLRADGQLVFIGRQRDVLKVGGENVAPAEIEALLMAMDEVEVAAVVGAPDPRLGEVPVAFVVATPGAAPEGAPLIARLQGRVASFKIPRRIVFVATLPATASGKLQKFKLRELLQDAAPPCA